MVEINLQRAKAAVQQPRQNVSGQIVGNAWVTTITKGKNAGRNGLTISFNANVTGLTGITNRTRLSLFPNNNMRAGKRDPEFLVVLSELPTLSA